MKNEKLSLNFYKLYKNRVKVYPSEFCLKFFNGSNKYKKLIKKNKKILDIGFGDGRDLILFDDLKMKVFGVEIHKKIVNEVKKNLNKLNKRPNLSVGTNIKTIYKNNFFDFIYSASTCSYLDNKNVSIDNIFSHIYSLCKKNGYFFGFILGHKSSLIESSKPIKKNVFCLNDNLKIRDNTIYYSFKNKKELYNKLKSSKFRNIEIFESNLNWFSRKSQRFYFICRK